jgi:hypothetical protein
MLGKLTRSLARVDAWRMIQRRAADLGTRVRIGCHTFRATGITAYLEAGGTLENAQAMAAHESPARRSSMIAPATKSRSTRSNGSRFEEHNQWKTASLTHQRHVINLWILSDGCHKNGCFARCQGGRSSVHDDDGDVPYYVLSVHFYTYDYRDV